MADPVLETDATLPQSWEPLRKAAEGEARQTHHALRTHDEAIAEWDGMDDAYRKVMTRGHAVLLADVTRQQSHAFWLDLLAGECACFNLDGEGIGYTFGPVFESPGTWRMWNYAGTTCEFGEDSDNETGDYLHVAGIAAVDPRAPTAALRMILLARVK